MPRNGKLEVHWGSVGGGKAVEPQVSTYSDVLL